MFRRPVRFSSAGCRSTLTTCAPEDVRRWWTHGPDADLVVPVQVRCLYWTATIGDRHELVWGYPRRARSAGARDMPPGVFLQPEGGNDFPGRDDVAYLAQTKATVY